MSLTLRISLAALRCCCLALTACTDGDEPEPDASFDAVRTIFTQHGCDNGSCHNATDAEAELDLTLGAAFDQLVDQPCTNPSALQTDKLRVAPFDVERSFLIDKLALQAYDAELGAAMPPTGDALRDEELDLVARWIEAGATP